MKLVRTVLAVAGLVVLLLATRQLDPPAALSVPANDNLANAITVTTPAVSGIVAVADVSGGTTEGSEKTVFAAGECGVAQSATITNTVWYTWTSPASPTNVIFETQGSDFDSHLALYTGGGFPLTQVACSDTFISDDGALSLTPAASTTYRIQIGKEGGAGGTQAFLSMTTGALIMVTTTNDENDSTINGFNVSLREAILFATDVRDPAAIESNRVIGSPGASSSDLIRFESSSVFPQGAPATIALGSALPALGTGGDSISGIGAGVIVNGPVAIVTCLGLSSMNIIEGLQMRACGTGLLVLGSANRIGGNATPTQRNVFRENLLGVDLFGSSATNNVVVGNYFGTDASGTSALGNTTGLAISGNTNTIGGSAPGQRNVISGNGIGVNITGSSNNIVQGNYIGTDVSGTVDLGNGDGILINNSANANTIGGSAPGQRNVISGNGAGIRIFSNGDNTGNTIIRGNFIGTDASGTSALGNSGGVTGGGVYIDGGDGNTIGGSAPGEGNLISANSSRGVLISSGDFNTVLGNKIGTDLTGNAALPNGEGVIVVNFSSNNAIGGAAPGEGNLISGNSGFGVFILNRSNLNPVRGNKIGTNLAGTAPLPNASAGVRVDDSQSNAIGGAGAGQANLIAFNGGVGVYIRNGGFVTIGNSIRANSIYSNAGGGIDNVTGGNFELPPPVISSANGGAGGGSVSGLACSSCTVDLFNDSSTQGRLYLGSTTANSTGNFNLPLGAHLLPNLTATNTDADGNSSEFSAALAVPADADGDGLPDSSDPCPLDPEDVDGFEDDNGCPDPDNDSDGVCDAGQVSVSCTGSDFGQMCFDPAGTLSCGTQDCRNIAEDYDAFKDTDGCPEPDDDNDGFSDADDQCDGVDSQTGPDGMLGSPQDLNHNGIKDASEATLTTDDVVLVFEDRDGVLDTDGCHDSPGDDFDGDGFTDEDEALHIGTNPGYPCGSGGWPADLSGNDNTLNIGDFNSFVFPLRANSSFNKFGHPVPDPDDANIARWNLDPEGASATIINIGDLNAINPAVLAPTARPPMFGGQPAFFTNGGKCPLPP